MNTLFLPDHNVANRLIIMFLGWGCRPENFRHLSKTGYDILIVNGYRNYSAEKLEATIDWNREMYGRGNYGEVVIVAWSFGIRLAADFKIHSRQNITLTLAVNGSINHVDDLRGIPTRIFNGTLNGLTPESLRKFQLRTAGSKAAFDEYFKNEFSPNEFEDLRRELEFFGNMVQVAVPDNIQSLFDKAIIGMVDRIFPPENLRNEWKEIDIFEVANMPHLPDFQMIFNQFIIDKSKVKSQFQKSAGSYGKEVIAQKKTAERLVNLLKELGSDPRRILEVGYGDGTLTRLYLPLLSPGSEITLCDIKESEEEKLSLTSLAAQHGIKVRFIKTDIEEIRQFTSLNNDDAPFDLIISASTIQWLNSPVNFICKSLQSLANGGYLAVAFYGDGTLKEISDITGNGLKYPSLTLLERAAKFERPDADVNAFDEQQQIEFATPAEALQHLKETGVNALSSSASTAAIRKLLTQWAKNESGSISLTFECKYITVRTP